MTSANARTVANLVLVSAAVAAAYVVITTPPLRRLAMRGLRVWLGASVPVYMTSQVRQAWNASERRVGPAQGRPEQVAGRPS
jgi:hypothetical protein